MQEDNKPKSEEPTPFEKFRSLAKKIVNVPREEYEQEQAKYEATKDKGTRHNELSRIISTRENMLYGGTGTGKPFDI